MPRRPGRTEILRARRGVVASTAAALLTLVLSGCGDNPVYLNTPMMTPADARACQHLKDALPDDVSGEHRRLTQPAAALGAAWGDDPPITMLCGVGVPDSFDKFATCEEANGVGWFVPDDQINDESKNVTMTTVGYQPRITVTVPAQLRPEAVAAAMSTLAGPVKQELELVKPCQ
jgi:hypothetical protein